MNKNILPLHQELFDPKRQEFFKELKNFADIGYLAGGTGLMLQIGHRLSFDFDIFTFEAVPVKLLNKVNKIFQKHFIKPQTDNEDELTVLIDEIKITFFYHEFLPLYGLRESGIIQLLDIRDIASDKAYTVGRRPMWRDYVDLYFLLRDHTNLEIIIKEAQARFGGNFSEKLFLEQLTYFGDIKEYAVQFPKNHVNPEIIQEFLSQKTREYLSI